MIYTPDLFPNEQDRIVPHDEGRARLAAIRRAIEAMPDEPAKARAAQQVEASLGREKL